MSAVRVSVLMTVYNAGPYLRPAIDSVLNQIFRDWELIVVDNASTDGGREVLTSYSDPRIRVTLLPSNIGRTPALRLAFEQVRGTWVAVLDADDIAHPDRLEKQVAFMEAHPEVSLLGTCAVHIDEHGEPVGRWVVPDDPLLVYQWFGWGNPIVHSSAMYRAEEARNVGGYPAEYPYSQDFGLWLKLVRPGSVAVMREYLCERRVLPQSMSNARAFRMDVERDAVSVLTLAGAQLALDDQNRRRNRDQVTRHRVKYGLALWCGGHRLSGCWAIVRAVASNPRAVVRQSRMPRADVA